MLTNLIQTRPNQITFTWEYTREHWLPVIPASNTVVEPFAMMIKVRHTFVAHRTMFAFGTSAQQKKKKKKKSDTYSTWTWLVNNQLYKWSNLISSKLDTCKTVVLIRIINILFDHLWCICNICFPLHVNITYLKGNILHIYHKWLNNILIILIKTTVLISWTPRLCFSETTVYLYYITIYNKIWLRIIIYLYACTRRSRGR